MVERTADTRYFATFEDREAAFRQRVFSLVARKYLGPARFWDDFRQISLDNLMAFARNPVACITADPRDCLAFGTSRQVLAAAVMVARRERKDFGVSAEALAERVGLGENLDQPLRTLSGGETVKLALARARAAAATSRSLAVASPFSWLSMENRGLFQELLQDCAGNNVRVEIFALEGEDDLGPLSSEEAQRIDGSPAPAFSLKLRSLRIPLTAKLGLVGERTALATVADFHEDLVSPCFLEGENGQGKSLVARALSRTIPFAGRAVVCGPTGEGSARLLFQDVIVQTLLRSLRSLARHTGTETEKEDAARIYGRILAGCKSAETGDGTGASLLAIKAALVAARIAARPGALILDEPDWGLNRRCAVAFVLSVVALAHARGVPVILISHKPWWTPLARCRIRVQRTARSASMESAGSFQIRLDLSREDRP